MTRRHRKRRKHRARPAGGRAKPVALQASPARGGTTPGQDAAAELTSGRAGGQAVQVAASGKPPNTGSRWEGTATAIQLLAPCGANGSVRGWAPAPARHALISQTGVLCHGPAGSGLLCYALQASVGGWLPAALWIVFAQRRVTRKQFILTARLRPI